MFTFHQLGILFFKVETTCPGVFLQYATRHFYLTLRGRKVFVGEEEEIGPPQESQIGLLETCLWEIL